MADFRQGYLDDYTQKDQKVGIGTSISREKLEIYQGGLTSKELNVTGISTFASSGGLIKTHVQYKENVGVNTGDSGTLGSEVIVGTGLTVSIGDGVTAGLGNVDSLKVYAMFQPPSGTTNQRPVGKPGALFYNFDFKTVEFFDGNSWRQVDNVARTGRAVHMGGNETTNAGSQADVTTTSDYVQIHTLGNAIDFGTLNQSTAQNSSYGSSIEIFSNGFGQSSTQQNYIQNAKFASGGNFEDFGDLSRVTRMSGSSNSSTRGVTGGGAGGSNVIDYLELQTKGNSLDFGDLLTGRRASNSTFASSTRGVFAGGADSNTASIEFIIFASKGNGIDFGGICTFAGGYKASSSNTTRGVQGGGSNFRKTIEAHVIASGGNAVDFGNLSTNVTGGDAAATQTRIVFCGGGVAPDASTRVNNIDYATISSSGNAQDFGDLTTKRIYGSASSDSHGGLGGF